MGKTLSRDERKNNKYTTRDLARAHKNRCNKEVSEKAPRPTYKKIWKPHSEIEV